MLALFARTTPRIRPLTVSSIRGLKTTLDDTSPLKTRIPVYKPDEDPSETVTIGKLREDQYAVAKLTTSLDYIKIDSLVTMSPEELSKVVAIPKGERALSDRQRIEKLEAEVDKLTKLLAAQKK